MSGGKRTRHKGQGTTKDSLLRLQMKTSGTVAKLTILARHGGMLESPAVRAGTLPLHKKGGLRGTLRPSCTSLTANGEPEQQFWMRPAFRYSKLPLSSLGGGPPQRVGRLLYPLHAPLPQDRLVIPGQTDGSSAPT